MVWLASRLRRALAERRAAGAGARTATSRSCETGTIFSTADDADGLSCPLGAHIRRANPRDDIKPYPAAAVAQHVGGASAAAAGARLRSARSSIPRSSAIPCPPRAAQALEALADDGQARGIHFFCVNASIRSQFEFVQQTWCNNPRFGGLNDNKDPITGDNDRADQPASHMTIPDRPFDSARARCRASSR